MPNGKNAPPRRRTAREPSVTSLSLERLLRAKAAFTMRRIDLDALYADAEPKLLSGAIRPRPGDVVLARVDRIGQHGRIELTSGRRARLHLGDEILVVFGDRYAPDQFESHVPLRLGATQLVASGGVASTVLSRSDAVRRATDITALGLLADRFGMPVNIAEFAIECPEPTVPRPRTIAVIGTSMNSGKTTTVESLVRGLALAGGKPGATKVTGTGSGADYWVMIDAGAHCVVDFTDAGLPSTFRIPFDVIEANFVYLVDHLTNQGCSEIVIEVADGVFQAETAQLIRSEAFRAYVDGVIFAAADAMGAVAGARHLVDADIPLLGVAGLFTRSPLAQRETAANCGVPVLCIQDLVDPDTATVLMKGGPVDTGRPLQAPVQLPDLDPSEADEPDAPEREAVGEPS
jgi:hypothetical protein